MTIGMEVPDDTARLQAPYPEPQRARSHSGRLGSDSVEDPMLARLILDPVAEPGTPRGGVGAGLSARDSRVDSVPSLPNGAHPALASRRAISDTPDALNAALPRHNPSRLGR